MVDQLPFLPFTNRLDGEADLFPQLVHLVAVQICDPGVGVEDGLNCAKVVFAGRLLIINKAGGEQWLSGVDREQVNRRAGMARDDAVDAVDPAVDVDLGQEFKEPAGSDFAPLRYRDRCSGEVARGFCV